jgi:multiple antibiotic resistance protein
VDILAAVITLLLVMDPLGNVPLFLSALKAVSPARRRLVLVRELLLAYGVLLVCVLAGGTLLRLLGLEQESISMAGGIVLFLISIRMIFPAGGQTTDQIEGEPFLVPLAVPLIAGPSTLAALLLLQRTSPKQTGAVILALTIAWAVSGLILLSSTFFYRVLRERGLAAMERLMGMILVMVAVQMFMTGLKTFLDR